MILQRFLRFNQHGAVELVVWTKDAEGNKASTVTPYKPNAGQLRAMAQNQYGELNLPKQ